MTLTPDQFPDFVAEAHQGRRPYQWQQRLLERVCRQGQWPDQIVAPTGAGKTTVVDVHLFAVALTAHTGIRVPRRLALVVDRRALTDDQYDYTRELINGLNAAESHSVLGQVAGILRELRWSGPDEHQAPEPVLLGRMRGGTPPSRAWLDEPEACAVLCATPAMWGSRLLFRGYGTSRAARPREAGLLAMDTVAVLDEAHLARQALTTARRVAELTAGEAEQLAIPQLQVVETTATTHRDRNDAIGVAEADLVHGVDDELRRRVYADKELTLEPLPSWPIPAKGAQRTKAVRRLAELAVEQHAEYGATVGCYVNTVDTALDLAAELERRSGLNIGVFCGRMRPHGADERLARLHATAPDNAVQPYDVVVTTQTLEVGVDCSFSAGITELASGAALAQRAGRIGRTGGKSSVTVLVPEQPLPTKARSGPYTAEELTDAHQWLDQLADLAPWTVATNPAPSAAPRRMLYQRLEPAEAEYLTRTSNELAHDHDVALWLSEDFNIDQDIGLLVRTDLPDEPDELAELIDATPVAAHEVFPVRLDQTLREALRERIPAEPGSGTPCIGLVRRDEVRSLERGDELAAGDLVVVDQSTELFRYGAAVPGPGATAVDDVLEQQADVGRLVLRIGDGSHFPRSLRPVQRFLEQVAELDDHDETTPPLHTVDGRRLLAGRLTELRAELPQVPASLPEVAALLGNGRVRDCEVTVHHDLDDEPRRLIVRDLRKATRDEETRQTFTSATEPVSLAQHNTAVGNRAMHLAQGLRLPDRICEVLATAGQHHDDGKADERFQRFLGARPEGQGPIAKSSYRSPGQERADRLASGLPRGWRHEQLSAMDYAGTLDAPLDEEITLALRLIGTSHGCGRPSFQQTGTDLLASDHPAHELAEQWYLDGQWEQLIEDTHRRWGPWGCAYLEALLRAADCQISMEGS